MMTNKALCRYYVATYGNLGLEVEFFDDPLAYGRATQAAERGHQKGEYDTYTHGLVDEAPSRADQSAVSPGAAPRTA
jgi:hypothetical protein